MSVLPPNWLLCSRIKFYNAQGFKAEPGYENDHLNGMVYAEGDDIVHIEFVTNSANDISSGLYNVLMSSWDKNVQLSVACPECDEASIIKKYLKDEKGLAVDFYLYTVDDKGNPSFRMLD